MESKIAVILLLACIGCFTEIHAKPSTVGNIDSNHLNSDSNELSINDLSTEVDNCHEVCLQKVRIFRIFCLLKLLDYLIPSVSKVLL